MTWRGISVLAGVVAVWSGAVWASAAEGACGAWRPVASPRAPLSSLIDVSAVSTTNVWTVGFYEPKAVLPLAEHWNGSSFEAVAVPRPGREMTSLATVAAVAPGDVWAAGTFGIRRRALVLHWNGSRWRRATLPLAAWHAQIFDAAAIAPDDVWMVGETIRHRTRTLHYNGKRWSIVPSVNPSSTVDRLRGVSATSSSDVWAVGTFNHDKHAHPLIEHWNGTAWTVSPSPVSVSVLEAVTAITPVDAWAVGYTPIDVAAEHWDGTAWTAVPPAPVGAGDDLAGVAASGPTDVWAVGFTFHPPLAEHWNGTRWSHPSTNLPHGGFYSITVVPHTTTYWAVGEDFTRNDRPLIATRC